MTDEELAQRLFLLKVSVMRHEHTDWLDGEDDIEMMLGESCMEPQEKQPIDLGIWLIMGVWLLVGVLSVVVMKRLVSGQ